MFCPRARLAVLIGLLLLPTLVLRSQEPVQKTDDLPISWTCPHHAEILETEKGFCPICKLALVPMRLDTILSCPVHAVIQQSQPGKCPICRRDLVQVIVAVTWTCPDKPEISEFDRGICPGGAPMIPKRAPRAHGNHNAQHGGLFFMAPDNWTHLEGTHPAADRFRVYLYDDYTKPLSADRFSRVTGRVVTQQIFDSATRTTREIAAFPLQPSPDGQYFEGRIAPQSLPAKMTAKLRLAPDGPEHIFDFQFPALSIDQAVSPVEVTTSAGAATISTEIPATTEGILVELATRNQEIRDLIQQGSFAAIYVPALQAKDLALALDDFATQLPTARRRVAVPAITQLVRSAWSLDAFGDLGDRQQITSVYDTFAASIAALQSAFRP
jgi:hypothetical protein